jgi:hypothetical protein
VLGRHLAGAVLELPRRIGEDGVELLPTDASEQGGAGLGKMLGHCFQSSGQRK